MSKTVLAVAAGAAAAALALGLAAAVRDYRRWTALGEGGIPWGLRGWLKVTRLRLESGDPFDTGTLPGGPAHPLVAALPRRDGERPRIAPHPIPHRQLHEDAEPAVLERLSELFAAELAAHEGLVEQQSRFEKHFPAIFSPALVDRGVSTTGEVAHFHRPQGSMHLHLSPADARVVIDRGWGELHGLSGGPLLPASYTLLYSPRTEADLEGVRSILRATLEWAAA